MSNHSRSRAAGFVLLALVLSLLLAGRLPAATQARTTLSVATPANLMEVSHTGGRIYSVTTRNDLAYVGESNRLTVLDISTSGAIPKVIGKSAPLPGVVEQIALAGNLALLAAREGGLLILDIADPAHPQQIGALALPSNAVSVAVDGDIAYVSSQFHDLRIIDISDPTYPVETAARAVPGYTTHNLAVAGNYVYIAAGDEGLQIVDVTDPARPLMAGALPTERPVVDVALSGNIVYLAAAAGGLLVVDISDPNAPVGLWQAVPTPRWALSVAVDGDKVYSYHFTGLQIFDVSIPAAPVEIAFLPFDDVIGTVHADRDTVFIAGYADGLRLVDVGDPAHPVEQSPYDLLDDSQHASLAGDLLYVVAAYDGLSIFDVSAPERPALLGHAESIDELNQIILEGDIAYVTAHNGGVYLFDISDPTRPSRLTQYNWPGVVDLAVESSILYIASDSGYGLRIYDVIDPFNPRSLGIYDPPSNVGYLTVVVENQFAYLIGDDGNLHILDVGDLAKPVPAGFFSTGGYSRDAVVDRGLAYLSDDRHGLRIVDVADPANPVELAAIGDPNVTDDTFDTGGLVKEGGYVTTWRWPEGVRHFNVVDPTRPFEVGRHENSGSFGAALSGDLIASAGGDNGLLLLRYTGPRTVAGRVGLAGGTPLSGVTVWAGPAHTTTDDDGAYYIIDAPPGDHTVRPALAGYTFDPPQTAVSLPPDRVDLNFTATAWAERRRVVLPVVGR